MYNSAVCSTLMSSVHEMDCLGEETVSVSGRFGAQSSVASTRRNSSKRECAGCEGPEWFCQLFCSFWIVQFLESREGCTNDRSAVRTTLRSLLRSDLIAELNQTVMICRGRIQWWRSRTVSAALCGRLNFRWRRKYNLCWAFLTIESMWVSHFRSWEMVVPRNLNDSTAVTVLFMMVSGGRPGGFLLKSTIISTVLSVLSFRLLRLHQTASSLTSCL